MPVKKDVSGKRSVETEVEVPGSPEEVWRAIATGPGISSWFVPSKVEERGGGLIEQDFGPNMESKARITAWDPPRRFTAGSDDMGPHGPTTATEWTVEARAGGTCVVRVVHSWFASTDDWDDQFEQTQFGWVAFFRILRAYLRDFRNQSGEVVQLMAAQPEPRDAAWTLLTEKLGLVGLERGKPCATRAGAPRLRGNVDHLGEGDFKEEALLRLEEPAAGLMHMFALPMAGQVFLLMRMFLFGPNAKDVARREEAAWQAWLQTTLGSQSLPADQSCFGS